LIYSTYPLLAIVSFSSAIFGTRIFISIPVAVASIQAMNLLKGSARWMPFFFGLLIEFLISMKRIQGFLLSDEIDMKMIKEEELNLLDPSLTIYNSNFSWGFKTEDKKEDSKEQNNIYSEISENSFEENLLDNQNSQPISYPVTDSIILKDLNLKIKPGEFVAIIGEVGAGKSSLIHSIIGDMLYINQETKEKFKDHYFSAAENGKEEEANKLNQELISKFNSELDSYKPEAHKNPPIKISGKICLIEQKPWIQNKTIRDNILFGEKLIIDKYNETIEYSQMGRDISILEGGDLTEIGEKGINLSGGQKARISIARAIYSDFDIVLMDDPLSALDAHVKHKIFQHLLLEKLYNKTRIMVTHAIDFLDKVDRIIVMDKGRIIYDGTFNELKSNDYFKLILSHMDKDDSESDEEKDSSEEEKFEKYKDSKTNHLSENSTRITTNENEEDANVEWILYCHYLKYNKVALVFFIIGIFCMTISQTSNVAFDISLLRWINSIIEERKNKILMFLLVILFSAVFIAFFLSGQYSMFKFSIKISKTLFNKMNTAIFNAPVNLYFDKTPTGIILNRFSKDLNTVDNQLI